MHLDVGQFSCYVNLFSWMNCIGYLNDSMPNWKLNKNKQSPHPHQIFWVSKKILCRQKWVTFLNVLKPDWRNKKISYIPILQVERCDVAESFQLLEVALQQSATDHSTGNHCASLAMRIVSSFSCILNIIITKLVSSERTMLIGSH